MIVINHFFMTVTVTNRGLLRNYKSLKDRLLSGELDQVVILQNNNVDLKISVERKLTPFEQLVEMVKKRPVLSVKRPDRDIF